MSAPLSRSAFLGQAELHRSTPLPFLPLSQYNSAPPHVHQRQQQGSRHRHSLVVEARKRKSLAEKFGGRQQQPPMAMPKIDAGDNDPKYVIFIKTKNVSIWYPLSMVSGGTTAKMLNTLMQWELGKKIYGGTLTRNIAAVVYKDEKAIQQSALKQFPMLKGASGFEYGYKVADPNNPKASFSGSGVIKIPPQEELKSVMEKAKEALDGGLSSIKDSFSGFSLPKLNQPESPQEPKK